MEIVAKCPKCDAGLPVDAAGAPAAITCGGCGRKIALGWSRRRSRGPRGRSLPGLPGRRVLFPEGFRSEDRPQRRHRRRADQRRASTGSAATSSRTASSPLPRSSISSCTAGWRSDVCYRCHCEFRGAYPRTAVGFDLHTADLLELGIRAAHRAIGSHDHVLMIRHDYPMTRFRTG